MFSVSARAVADDVSRVWSEIESRRKEILDEERAFLEGRSEEWLRRFWENEQKAVLKKSRRLPFKTLLMNICYSGLQKLVCLSMLLVLIVLIVRVFDDAPDFVKVIGKISIVFMELGLWLTAVSAICWFNRTVSEGVIKSSIAVQQILAEDYNLVSQYSEDVNGYAVIMMAASEHKLSSGKRTRQELEKMEQDAEDGIFTLNTTDDVPVEDEEDDDL